MKFTITSGKTVDSGNEHASDNGSAEYCSGCGCLIDSDNESDDYGWCHNCY